MAVELQFTPSRFHMKSASMKDHLEGVRTSFPGLFPAGRETKDEIFLLPEYPSLFFISNEPSFSQTFCLCCFLLLAGIQNECEESDKGSNQCDTANAKSSNLENFLEFHFISS